LQREVADHAGIDRSTYIKYESKSHGLYDFDMLTKIAQLLGVALDDLLDEYNRFVFAQGENLKRLRKRQGLTQARLAELMRVNAATVKKWERGQVRMTKRMWERLQSIKNSDSARCAA
jgi:transcriptional regulator with XRE-family HTH domain